MKQNKSNAETSRILAIQQSIEEVQALHNATPDGTVVDADTLLVDAIESCEYEFSGFAEDIFDIWRNSTDKASVEQMFYEFTDMEFEDYLNKCKKEISR